MYKATVEKEEVNNEETIYITNRKYSFDATQSKLAN